MAESPDPRDPRTQYQRSKDSATQWSSKILAHGIEVSCSDTALDVRLYDKRFAQYCDMLEHIKAEYFNYVRDKYGSDLSL